MLKAISTSSICQEADECRENGRANDDPHQPVSIHMVLLRVLLLGIDPPSPMPERRARRWYQD
jgi:hypothetical protein